MVIEPDFRRLSSLLHSPQGWRAAVGWDPGQGWGLWMLVEAVWAPGRAGTAEAAQTLLQPPQKSLLKF